MATAPSKGCEIKNISVHPNMTRDNCVWVRVAVATHVKALRMSKSHIYVT